MTLLSPFAIVLPKSATWGEMLRWSMTAIGTMSSLSGMDMLACVNCMSMVCLTQAFQMILRRSASPEDIIYCLVRRKIEVLVKALVLIIILLACCMMCEYITT